jgi:CrcB protein
MRRRRVFRGLVVVGGMVGTGLRYASFEIWYHVPGTFPTTTLVVNALGSFVLGMLLVVRPGGRYEAEVRSFAVVGVLGGFTTFSAYAVELALYVRAGSANVGLIFATAMTAFGVIAVLMGTAAGRAIRARQAVAT